MGGVQTKDICRYLTICPFVLQWSDGIQSIVQWTVWITSAGDLIAPRETKRGL
jgi:hypothetical protein